MGRAMSFKKDNYGISVTWLVLGTHEFGKPGGRGYTGGVYIKVMAAMIGPR